MSALPPKADIAPNKPLSEFCGGGILTSESTTDWHADCFVTGMTDENYPLVLLQLLCLLMFSCGGVLIRRHLGYFGDMRTQSVCSAGAGSGRAGRSCHSAPWGVQTQTVVGARLVA